MLFRSRTVALIGHQKGRDLKERLARQYGMPSPEGYTKAMRIMDIAERFDYPLISLVDTPGAFPGVAAEQHGQGGAIARSQARMMALKVPTVACVIGEGGSGGALALAVSDRVMMQENAIYSVITPEGCAMILWRDREEKKKAAAAQDEVEELKKSVEGKNSEIGKLKESLDSEQKQVSALKDELSASQKDNTSLRGQLEKATKKITDLESFASQLHVEDEDKM